MAEVDSYNESSSSQGASRPRRRVRRAAGAPAGAPSVAPEQTAPSSSAHTSVAAQGSAVVSDAKPLNLRERRLAERAAKKEAEAATGAPVSDAAGSHSTEPTDQGSAVKEGRASAAVDEGRTDHAKG
ncbi:MAG: ribonuclease E/G, partial [Dermabacter sp.]|nr:ribonuclease E/G [Dermabacter sp.]